MRGGRGFRPAVGSSYPPFYEKPNFGKFWERIELRWNVRSAVIGRFEVLGDGFWNRHEGAERLGKGVLVLSALLCSVLIGVLFYTLRTISSVIDCQKIM